MTARKREVLELIAASSLIDDRALAEKLQVSPDTVHVHRLLRKKKLRDRRYLVVLALLLRAPPLRYVASPFTIV